MGGLVAVYFYIQDAWHWELPDQSVQKHHYVCIYLQVLDVNCFCVYIEVESSLGPICSKPKFDQDQTNSR